MWRQRHKISRRNNLVSQNQWLKPGGKPILWHIMKAYSYYGVNRFILALGYKGDYIKTIFIIIK